MSDNFLITTKPVAHMVKQIRMKQLAANDALNKLKDFVVDAWLQEGLSKEELIVKITAHIDLLLEQSLKIKEFLDASKVSDVGYPIRYSKTHLQLQMAKEWIAKRGEQLIDDIKDGKFHNELKSDVNEFPKLQALSTEEFWGNENASVSGIILASIATMYNHKALNLTLGSATFCSFYDQEFKLPQELSSYPFANNKGMFVFGDYQFGGHRYFSNENIGIGQSELWPEDCSSALAKAIDLPIEEVLSFNTTELRNSYTKAYENYEDADINKYGLICVTSNDKEKEEDIDFSRIKPGQIYLRGGHTALITTVKDDQVCFSTVEFNRDLEDNPGKRCGGGQYEYNLLEKIAEEPQRCIYIFEKPDSEIDPLYLQEHLVQIDAEYREKYDGHNVSTDYGKFEADITGYDGDVSIVV